VFEICLFNSAHEEVRCVFVLKERPLDAVQRTLCDSGTRTCQKKLPNGASTRIDSRPKETVKNQAGDQGISV